MNVKGIVEAYNKEVEIWGFDNITVGEENLGIKRIPYWHKVPLRQTDSRLSKTIGVVIYLNEKLP